MCVDDEIQPLLLQTQRNWNWRVSVCFWWKGNRVVFIYSVSWRMCVCVSNWLSCQVTQKSALKVLLNIDFGSVDLCLSINVFERSKKELAHKLFCPPPPPMICRTLNNINICHTIYYNSRSSAHESSVFVKQHDSDDRMSCWIVPFLSCWLLMNINISNQNTSDMRANFIAFFSGCREFYASWNKFNTIKLVEFGACISVCHW